MQHTFTSTDRERIAAATAVSDPIPGPERKAYPPAARVLLAALADGTPATVHELALAAGLTPDDADGTLRRSMAWSGMPMASRPAWA